MRSSLVLLQHENPAIIYFYQHWHPNRRLQNALVSGCASMVVVWLWKLEQYELVPRVLSRMFRQCRSIHDPYRLTRMLPLHRQSDFPRPLVLVQISKECSAANSRQAWGSVWRSCWHGCVHEALFAHCQAGGWLPAPSPEFSFSFLSPSSSASMHPSISSYSVSVVSRSSLFDATTRSLCIASSGWWAMSAAFLFSDWPGYRLDAAVAQSGLSVCRSFLYDTNTDLYWMT